MIISKSTLVICIIIALISFLGFITENIWLAFTKGVINNRNMSLPFLFGYGLAVILFYYFFNLPTAPFLFGIALDFSSICAGIIYYILTIATFISLGECILGILVEKICNIEWWNYSRLPFHIGKYTSVFTSLGFAGMITLFMHFYFEPIFNYLMNLKYPILFLLGTSLMFLMVSDFLYSIYIMYKNKSLNKRWSINISIIRGEK